MTLEEKLAQLGSTGCSSSSTATASTRQAHERLGRGHRPDHARRRRHEPRDAGRAALANEIQRLLVEQTRLGIPAIVHEECLHGLVARDAVCFPQSIGLAAAWDPELVEELAAQLRAPAARDRRPPGPGAGPRRRARPALGPHRGDLRRGPVPDRGARRRLRPRPAGGRRRAGARDRQALGRPRPARGRHEPRAGAHRPARAARRLPVAVRGGRPRGRDALDDARLRGRRRGAVRRLARAAHHHAARRVGLRRDRRLRLRGDRRAGRRRTRSSATSGRPPPWRSRPGSTSSCPRPRRTARRWRRRSPTGASTRRSSTAPSRGSWP